MRPYNARMTISQDSCTALDAQDPLREFRKKFAIQRSLIYLDGNSLGALPAATPARIAQVVKQEWGGELIKSWNNAGWVDMPQRVGNKIGKLIGARPGETVACDCTSVNLYKTLSMALSLKPERKVILTERDNFPTDLYIAKGLVAQMGGAYELRMVEAGEIEASLSEDVAVVMLSHVNFRTGAMFDLEKITAAAHMAGALMLWDLAHSTGAVPVDLNAVGADFAVGCGYKYLNGGPGAPAFAFIHKKHHNRVRTPLTGWFGHVKPFAFAPHYTSASDASLALVGTPPILSLAALEVGVDLMLEAGMEAVRAKSVALTDLFIALVDQELKGFTLGSPRESALRGSQVCLQHENAWPICQALIASGVIGDFRTPDVLRFGFAPLYVSYSEVWAAVAILKQIMRNDVWQQPQFQQDATVP